MEPRRRADVRLHGGGSGRAIDPDDHSRRALERRGRRPAPAPARRKSGPLRNGPPPEGRHRAVRVPDDFAATLRVRHRHRRVEDRARHHRDEAGGTGAGAVVGPRTGGSRGGRAGQPPEGRLPRGPVPRASHPVERGDGIQPAPQCGQPAPGASRARDSGDSAERTGAGPAGGVAARSLACDGGEARAEPGGDRFGLGDRVSRRRASAGGGDQVHFLRCAHAAGEDAHGRRRGKAAAGVLEPPVERHQIHAGARPRRRHGRGHRGPRGGRRALARQRGRQRPGHQSRLPAARLRPVQAGREQGRTVSRRARPRARARPRNGAGARRDGGCRKPRGGQRQHVHRNPAAQGRGCTSSVARGEPARRGGGHRGTPDPDRRGRTRRARVPRAAAGQPRRRGEDGRLGGGGGRCHDGAATGPVARGPAHARGRRLLADPALARVRGRAPGFARGRDCRHRVREPERPRPRDCGRFRLPRRQAR